MCQNVLLILSLKALCNNFALDLQVCEISGGDTPAVVLISVYITNYFYPTVFEIHKMIRKRTFLAFIRD